MYGCVTMYIQSVRVRDVWMCSYVCTECPCHISDAIENGHS